MNILKSTALAAAALGALVLPAQSQELGLTPFAGGGFFASHLAGETGLEDGGAFGAHLSLKSPLGLGLRGTFAYLPTEVAGHEIFADGAGQNVLLWGAGVTFDFPVRSPVRPYLVAGLGAKTYDPDPSHLDAETDFMWNVGAGLELPVAPRVGLQLEVADYMSSFDPGLPGLDGELQHDLLVTLGLSLRFSSGR